MYPTSEWNWSRVLLLFLSLFVYFIHFLFSFLLLFCIFLMYWPWDSHRIFCSHCIVFIVFVCSFLSAGMQHLLLVVQIETFIVMSRFSFMELWDPQPSDTEITQLRPFFTFKGWPTNPGNPGRHWKTLDFLCPWNNTLEIPEIATHPWKSLFWRRFPVYKLLALQYCYVLDLG